MPNRIERKSGTALAVLALCHAGHAHADVDHDIFKRQKTETNGMALSGGVGTQYVTLGLQATYYVQLPRSLFRVAPWVTLGGAIWSNEGSDTVALLGTAYGVSGSWGHQHRITVSALYGPAAASGISLHGEDPDVRLEWGPAMTLGYEYMAFSGFFFRADAGVHLVVTAPIMPLERQIVPALTLVGLGYKLW